MNKIIQWIIGIIAVAALILGLVGGNKQSVPKVSTNERLGGMTNLDALTITPVDAGDAFKVGANGSSNSENINGFCTLIGGTGGSGINASQAASSTKPYDCAVTGVVSGDVVIAQLSTSTPFIGNNGPWFITGAKASTTANFITVLLTNNGAAAVPSASGIGSSTAYSVYDITP